MRTSYQEALDAILTSIVDTGSVIESRFRFIVLIDLTKRNRVLLKNDNINVELKEKALKEFRNSRACHCNASRLDKCRLKYYICP